MTKVVAINGSPRMEKGNTARILTPFLEGMTNAGASVELFYTKQLDIKPCTGGFICWYNKPGRCYISDDMKPIYPKLRKAEILVLATPVYIPLPGQMQNLINRLCPLIEPILKFEDGRTRARLHAEVEIRKVVLVSTCGWWEKGNFGTVLRIAKELSKDLSVEFAGAVLRPHAFLMANDEEKTGNILNAAKQAGYQLIKKGRISKDLLKIISQPLISEDGLRQRYNKAYHKAKNGKKN